MAKRKSKEFLSLGFIIALIILVGCSDGKPTRVPVSGQVLIDGKPLKMGSIMFVAEGARPSGSAIDSEGRFNLSCYERGDGAVIGKHLVRVTAAENISETAVRWHAPKKYADETTSGIEVTIEEPTNDLVINISWEGGKPFVESYGVR